MSDMMHVCDHGHIPHILKYPMKQLLRLEEVLGLPKYTFLKKLICRVRLMTGACSGTDGQSLSRHHQTLLCVPKTVEKLFNSLAGRGSKQEKSNPIVDANEMQRLGLALPYLFEGLCSKVVAQYNTKTQSAAKCQQRHRRTVNSVFDSSRGITEVMENYLTWYASFR